MKKLRIGGVVRSLLHPYPNKEIWIEPIAMTRGKLFLGFSHDGACEKRYDVILFETIGIRVRERLSINVACGNSRIPRKLRPRQFTVSERIPTKERRFDLNRPVGNREAVQALSSFGFAEKDVAQALASLDSVWRY